MRMCFAALIKILRYCSKPKVYNKTLCGAIVKSIDEYYGGILESDDGAISRLMSCDNNLSPENVVFPARTADMARVSSGIKEYVLPLLDENKIKLAVAAIQGVALSDEIDHEAQLGRMKWSELLTKTVFNPSDFIGDVFLYVASAVENKSGKETIGQLTNDYIRSFNQYTANITIDETVVVEMEELGCTLDDSDFCAIFREVEHPETLELSNKSKLNLYYLDISDSAFDYEAIGEYLLDCASMYVYNRTQIKDFEDRHRVRSMGARALRTMQENGLPDERGTGNELGEMLLFTFMEGALHAPKLLSKVEIVTAGRQYNSKSDSVHLLKRKVNGAVNYQLVFGTSCINENIQSAIDNAFAVLTDIKNGKTNERHMVDSTLLNRTYDDETTARLRQILVPNRDRSMAPDIVHSKLRWYAFILNKWISGVSLKQMIAETIENDLKPSSNAKVRLNNAWVPFENTPEHINALISSMLETVDDVILFRLSNYFLKFSEVYKSVYPDRAFMDWYEFVEYGATDPLAIWLQRNGFTREAATYIRSNRVKYVIQTPDNMFLSESLLECDNQSIQREAKQVHYNNHELFLPDFLR